MSLEVEEWRIWIGSEDWDNQTRTGTIRILGYALDEGSPTEAKYLQVLLPDNATTRAITEMTRPKIWKRNSQIHRWSCLPTAGKSSATKNVPIFTGKRVHPSHNSKTPTTNIQPATAREKSWSLLVMA